MRDLLSFAFALFVILTIIVICGVKPKNLVSYFKSEAGKGAAYSALKGIAVILIVGSAIVFFVGKAQAQSALDNQYGHFLNRAYVYAGADYNKRTSPQCVEGSTSDRMASNMGFGLNLWETKSRRVQLDLHYTHHSCILGIDRNGYDAVGLRLTWVPWERKRD